MKTCTTMIATGLVLGLVVTAPTSAGVVDIGGGWQAEWDPSLDDFVDVSGLGVVDDAVFIQKSAEFTQGPVSGIFPSIAIVFRQIDPLAVGNIVIDEEIIVNSTGTDWTGYDMTLLDSGNALFDPVATAGSGGGGPIGFSIAPFGQAEFSDDLTRLSVFDGVVADGTSWFPGDGATDGQLWLDVTATGSTVFTFVDRPVPAPAAMALLALGGLTRRRRRG